MTQQDQAVQWPPELTLTTPIKFLRADHLGPHSYFDYTPFLPEGGAPGKWLEVRGQLEVCVRGIHYTTPEHAMAWLREECWLIEAQHGERHGDKWLAPTARLVRQLPWDTRTLRLFACDCAERILPVYMRRYPNDRRVAECIAVARRYANGAATHEELRAAREDAYAAAAASSAYAAAYAAYAAYAAADAAAAAADGAADAAAAADADADARAEERRWQAEQLLRYLRGELP